MIEPLELLELLYEEAGLPDFDLPEELRALYAGTLGFDRPSLFVNFVSTIDGVVSIPATPRSNRLISDESGADQFVMALLRACADVVLISSGTLNASPKGFWTATDAYPPGAGAIAEFRRRLGLPPEPAFAVLTASGAIDPEHRALQSGALVLTTDHGATTLEGRLREGVEVVVLPGKDKVDLAAAIAFLHSRGMTAILSEAGPTILGALLAAGLVDELFLTVSPLLAGRSGDDIRIGLVEGIDLLPDTRVAGRLLGVRRQDAHLFLRYAF
ncbi:MAG: dihydrofolate reductase family protein [Gaiellaceae bacterium]